MVMETLIIHLMLKITDLGSRCLPGDFWDPLHAPRAEIATESSAQLELPTPVEVVHLLGVCGIPWVMSKTAPQESAAEMHFGPTVEGQNPATLSEPPLPPNLILEAESKSPYICLKVNIKWRGVKRGGLSKTLQYSVLPLSVKIGQVLVENCCKAGVARLGRRPPSPSIRKWIAAHLDIFPLIG